MADAATQDASQDPSTPSVAYEALSGMWERIRDILSGADAIKEKSEAYLPSYPAEASDEYDRRLRSTPWRPEFEDALRSLVSRPFSKEVTLASNTQEDTKALAENIDGRGNNLHVFAEGLFREAIAMGAVAILVDFPVVREGATRAETRNLRPYWVPICADEIIALRTEWRGAIEVVTHLRISETAVVYNGFEEVEVEQIRILEPGTWEVWRKENNSGSDVVNKWYRYAGGTSRLNIVPLVFIALNKREGAQFVKPPLNDLAVMQIELYQALSRKDEVLTYAGSPMLAAIGIAPPQENGNAVSVAVGPKTVLFAPPGPVEGPPPDWKYIQPDAANIKEVREDVRSVIDDMRRLGLQPLIPRSGNVAATASGVDAFKGDSAVQTWANALKDGLEQAWVFTQMWRNSTEVVKVSVHTDFSVGAFGSEELRELREARAKGQITRRTYHLELMRRGVLGPQFDLESEAKALGPDEPPTPDPEGGATPSEPGDN